MNKNLSIGRSLKRYLLLGGLLTLSFLCVCSVAEAPVCKTYTTRVTAANFRSRVNCEGKSLRKLAKEYGNICAIEQKTLPLYTQVSVSGIKYMIVDVMPRKSTNKHYRRANRRDINLDLCLDRYKDVPRKQLHKYDLGITEIHIIK